METSFAIGILGRERAADLLRRHPAEYILFGSDSPWDDQADALAVLQSLGLGPDREARILRTNALEILGLDGLPVDSSDPKPGVGGGRR